VIPYGKWRPVGSEMGFPGRAISAFTFYLYLDIADLSLAAINIESRDHQVCVGRIVLNYAGIHI